MGAIQAWRLAAEEMAQAGKHVIISSQNSFQASTPYLMKTKSCPVSEDEAFAVMNSSSLARKGWARFYEYFAHPGDQHSAAANALYCANSIRNAAREASLGVPFVAAASNYPWGSPGSGPTPSPGPHHPPPPPCDTFKSQSSCPPRCIWDSSTCDPLPPPPAGTEESSAIVCSNPGAQWEWDTPQSGSEVRSVALGGSPLRLGTWPNCKSSVVSNGTELEVGGGSSKSVCPPLKFKLTSEGRLQLLFTRGAATVEYCVAIPPHASAKLFECNFGDKTDDEQRFVWKNGPTGKGGTLALAAGQFRSGRCLGLVKPKTTTTIMAAPLTLADATVSLEFSLAMFLLAREGPADPSPAGMGSYFEYNHEGWAGWPRWADDDTSWDEVKDLFDKVAAAGEPLGSYNESAGMVFSRKFERLTVAVDCTNRRSNYTWE